MSMNKLLFINLSYICISPANNAMKYIYAISVFLILTLTLNGQPKCFFEHYGSEDGLPQHNVTGILQDKKDFIWLSTWDGLCKFDGYNFSTYKIQQGDLYHMRTNRIEQIHEDKYGFIWTLSYDKEAHRFDPGTEKFMSLKSLDEYKDFTITTNRIKPTTSGKVWLLSEKMGCVCISDSTFKVVTFNVENKKINGNHVYDVFEDKDNTAWILTNNGLYSYSADGTVLNNFFTEKAYIDSKSVQDFYTATEFADEIWFGSNYGRIWVYNKPEKKFHLLETSSKSAVKFIKNIDNAHVFIGTDNDGFFIYDVSSKKFMKYDSSVLPEMTNNKIISYYIDRSKNLWLELDQHGAFRFDLQKRTIKSFMVKTETPGTYMFPPGLLILEDNKNRIWIQPRGGGFSIYNPEKEILESFYNEPNSQSWRFSNMLHTAFFDKQGNLWMSTRSYGLEKIIFNDDVFKSSIVDKNVNSTINNDIRFIFEDNKNNLWISSKSEKIYVYDSLHNELGYVCNNGTIGHGTPLNVVAYNIFQDIDQNIWIGTKGYGLFVLSPAKEPGRYNIKQYKNSTNDLYSISSDNVYTIFQDNKKRIWIGTYGGGINLMDCNKEGRFFNYKNNLKDYPTLYGSQVRVISSDKFGNICVGTTLGLIMFSSDFNSADNIKYKFYTRTPGNNESLSGNDVHDIFTTKNGTTYLATFGGGINQIVSVDDNGFPLLFQSYTTQNGLPSDVALAIMEDNHNKLWITTEGYLTKFDPDDKSFETFSEISRLIRGQNFSEGSKCKSHSGKIYFGYSKGFITIDPDIVKDNTYNPYVALTKLQISNKDIPIEENSVLSRNIDDIKEIILAHNQNFINIEFAALDYIEPQRIMYTYKLEGFDKEWIISKKQRMANYTNLSPGEYTFKVKSTNSDGVWMDNEHSLIIRINPSFWQTGWARTIYIIIALIIIYIIFRSIFIYYRLKDKIKLEQEQTEMKTRFFIDISHEIRTPLTMIVSPLQNIIDEEDTSAKVKNQLNLVMKNANRMLRMVNQILDFRKLQKQKLVVKETVIGDYVSVICDAFSKTAEVQGISLKVNNLAQNEKIWVDRDSIEKLVFNLLSNAFKYSEMVKGKGIEVNIFKKDNHIGIQVKDEGKGMTKDIQNKLFTRFASYNPDKSKPSTGIGLSIVKEVADKHHAKILVDSEYGQGSCFTILFPCGTKHFISDMDVILPEIGVSDPTTEEIPANVSDVENGSLSENNEDIKEKEQTILIVEDDADLRDFIKSMLTPYYKILEAGNGKAGYDLAVTELPDFILSDIMMPELDGVELLQKIRINNETSHIPIILLTAKTNLESKLEGLKYGADDYITKPFNVKYLKARIGNIIEQRKRLYKGYLEKEDQDIEKIKDADEKVLLTPQDELFIRKVIDEVEKNIDNSDFVIDDLVSVMAMSRSVFFRKLKSLTGLAPVEFIRDIRIKQAGKLISTKQYTIKEISFMVGISDMKYFNMWFKRIMGMTPSEYRIKAKK